jgi:hypothetical protein
MDFVLLALIRQIFNQFWILFRFFWSRLEAIFLGRYGRLKRRYYLQRSLLWFILVLASPLYAVGIRLALGRCLVEHLIRSV